MSFIVNTIENMLHLTDAEKKIVEAAMPTIAVWAKMLNQQWGTLADAIGWLGNSKAVALRLLDDFKKLGPIAEDVLTTGGSIFEAGSAMSAINDIKAVIAANPKLVAALTADYHKLAPLITQVQNDMDNPEIQAAISMVQSKMQQHDVTPHALASKMVKDHGTT